MGQNELNRLQMIQFVCRKHRNPCVSSTFVEFPFHIFSPPLLPQYKEMVYYGSVGKKVENVWNKMSSKAANDPFGAILFEV